VQVLAADASSFESESADEPESAGTESVSTESVATGAAVSVCRSEELPDESDASPSDGDDVPTCIAALDAAFPATASSAQILHGLRRAKVKPAAKIIPASSFRLIMASLPSLIM